MTRIGVLLVASVLMAAGAVQGTQVEDTWAQAWYDALLLRNAVLQRTQDLREGITIERMQKLMDSLFHLPGNLTGLDNLDVSTFERDKTLINFLLNQLTGPVPKTLRLFRNRFLQTRYKHGHGFLIKTFQGYHNFRCIQALYSPSGSIQEYNLPLDLMCSKLRRQKYTQTRIAFSTDKICRNLKECSGVTRPYPYRDPRGTSVRDACTDENQCDVEKALPMMVALLWYQVSDYIAHSLCYNSLRRPHKSNLNRDHEEIKAMVRLVMAYASTLNWDLFFQESVRRRAYSNLDTALTLVGEYEKSFAYSPVACFELQADDSCIFADINKEYQSIRKVQSYRLSPTKTRNLRLYARVNHVKMIALKRRALQQMDLLGNIRSVDENLGSATEGIRNYFRSLAEYDQGIADQDVGFLAGKLTDFEAQAATLSAKVQTDVRNAMIAMTVNLGVQVVEKVTILAVELGEHANPFKSILGSPDVDDIIEKGVEVAQAIQQLAHGAALLANYRDVYQDMGTLARKFKDNSDQISNLQTMVDAIKANNVEDIGIDADNFIQAYGSYTPKVDRDVLAKNDALWAAYKDSTCDLLFGAEGIAASVGQGVAGGMLLCEKLEGTLAEFAALRENIFDFQFDLVDSIARVVRGNIAKKLSTNIAVANEVLKSSTLMLGFFMTHRRLQSEASLYCDKLEYRNQGKAIEVCSPNNGLFTPSNLDDLLAYNPDTTYHLDERIVYIPTKPQFPGDMGFIPLGRLAEGHPVTFRLPGNRTWLRQYNWLASGETLAPYVESFKLYLPHRAYLEGNARQFSKTRITLTSIAGSAVSDSSDVVYNLPLEHSHYITVYSEGYNPSRCPSGKELKNPYSLCDNLPDICDTATRIPGNSMMPTVLSTWKLSYRSESTTDTLEWDAPDPATNLLLIANVKLRFLPELSNKRGLTRQKDEPAAGCCTDNKYRPKWNDNTCVACPSTPSRSRMSLNGYYCTKGNEAVAGEPIEYPDNYPPTGNK